MRGKRVVGAVFIAVVAFGGVCLAGFSGTDVFLPSVGQAQGIANWYTAVWVHNPGTSPALAQFFFLERNKANIGAIPITVTVPPGDTLRYPNVMAELFGRESFGAIRVQSSSRLVVTSRIFSKATSETERDSKGQDFAGVPASFAIGAGQKTDLVGVYQTQPTGDSELRYNFGFVEVAGESCTVAVTPRDATGAATGAAKSYTVQALEQRQFQFSTEFSGLSTENTRLEIEVTGGSGRIIAFGSAVTNGSQDPTTFEMSFRDELLAENAAGGGSILGVTAGAGLTGGGTSGTVTLAVGAGDGLDVSGDSVAIADGGVTKGKLAAAGGTNGQVLGTDGTGLVWRDPAAGSGTGDISAVNAGTGLAGGGTTGDVTLSVATGGIANAMLAANAVTSDKVTDGAVTKSKLAAAGGTNGQVLGTDGTGLVWRDPAAGSGTGDISAVNAGTGLAGGGTTGDVTLSVATGGIANAMLAANAVTSEKVTDGAIAAADLASGAVTKAKLAASGGTNNQVLGTDGTNLVWKDPASGSGSGDITAVFADSGLTGGGTTGDVTLAIATGGITTNMLAVGTVTSDKIFDGEVATADLANGSVTAAKIADGAVGTADLHDGVVTKAKLAAGGGANNQVLSTDGTNLLWKDPPSGSGTGDITAVTAGAGLAGGGTTGDVTLGIASNGVTTAMLANAAVTLSKLDGSGALAGKVLKNNGGAVVWGDDETGALTVPLEIRAGSSSPLMTIENTSTGGAAELIGPGGAVLRVTGAGAAFSSGTLIAESTASGSGATAITALAQGVGVFGTSGAGIGVQGYSTSGSAGVRGWCHSCASGVLGEIDAGSGFAVKGSYTGGTTWGGLGSSDAGVEGAHGTARSGYLGTSDAAVSGVSSAGYAVHGSSSANGLGGVAVRAEATGSNGVAIFATNSSSDATIVATNTGTGRLIKLYGGPSSDLRFTVHNSGDVRADGTFASPAADFAEMLPGRDGLEPGDVLAIGADGRLMRSVEAYQASVLGVYSTRPAFLGGSGINEDAEGLVPLAVVGVVPVKVSAENGAIRPGDMLVSSSIPGHAMRAGATVPNGRGIGKALGTLENGTGVISMLVILQ